VTKPLAGHFTDIAVGVKECNEKYLEAWPIKEHAKSHEEEEYGNDFNYYNYLEGEWDKEKG
jgi:hypothetical protein